MKKDKHRKMLNAQQLCQLQTIQNILKYLCERYFKTVTSLGYKRLTHTRNHCFKSLRSYLQLMQFHLSKS